MRPFPKLSFIPLNDIKELSKRRITRILSHGPRRVKDGGFNLFAFCIKDCNVSLSARSKHDSPDRLGETRK